MSVVMQVLTGSVPTTRRACHKILPQQQDNPETLYCFRFNTLPTSAPGGNQPGWLHKPAIKPDDII